MVERLVSGNWSLAKVSYKTYASYCWLRVRPGENVSPMQRARLLCSASTHPDPDPDPGQVSRYAQALLCLPSTLHANCLSGTAEKLGVMQTAQALFRERCGSPRFEDGVRWPALPLGHRDRDRSEQRGDRSSRRRP